MRWHHLARSRSVRGVATAATLLLLLVAGVVLAGVGYQAQSSRTVVGRNEPVTISAPSGNAQVRAVARLDTGADRSSVDRATIDALGLDLTGAPTINVASALGSERRPLVRLDIEVAGVTRSLEVSVADRSDRSYPILLGVDALGGLVVDPDRSDASQSPSTTFADDSIRASDTLTRTDLPAALLLLLPLATAIVVSLRMVIGLQPLGTFAPVLLAVAVVHAGPVYLFLAATALAATFVVQPALARLRIPRQARLATLIGVVVLIWLIVLGGSPEHLAAAQGVPVIVTVVVLDRLWAVITDDGPKQALRASLHTALATVLVLTVIGAEAVHALALRSPALLVVAGIVVAIAAGSYRGLRFSELYRFPHPPAGPTPTPLIIDLTQPATVATSERRIHAA